MTSDASSPIADNELDAETHSTPGTDRRARWPVALAGTVVGLFALLSAFLLGQVEAGSRIPDATSADAGFLRDMQAHHAQAVEMSMLVRDRTNNPEVRAIAYDITTAQSQQMGVMYGWLQLWGFPQHGEPMTWMHENESAAHHAHDAPAEAPTDMAGMATPEQMGALAQATGASADRLYLELMIAHHEGGIHMAEAATSTASHPRVTALANQMIESQTVEIETMSQMLEAR